MSGTPQDWLLLGTDVPLGFETIASGDIVYLCDKASAESLRRSHRSGADHAGMARSRETNIPVGTVKCDHITTYTYSPDCTRAVVRTSAETYPFVWDGQGWRRAEG